MILSAGEGDVEGEEDVWKDGKLKDSFLPLVASGLVTDSRR